MVHKQKKQTIYTKMKENKNKICVKKLKLTFMNRWKKKAKLAFKLLDKGGRPGTSSGSRFQEWEAHNNNNISC